MLLQGHGRLGAWVGAVGLPAAATLRSASAQSAPPGAGECGTCHYDLALAYTFPAGHAAALDCIACHGDRRPGRVGRRHRTIPNCATCHDDVHGHPTKAAERLGRRQTRNCLNCHDPHGGANLHLVRNLVRSRQHLYDVTFTVDAGLAPGGLASPTDPGSGMCEVCHRKTDFYPAKGRGDAHFTANCTLCHDPHGSPDIKLVRETITTPGGANRPITFDNLTGLADGSFANASAPGTGVCEICHTTTNHYRMDGTGSPHFTYSCLGCHRHDDGFRP